MDQEIGFADYQWTLNVLATPIAAVPEPSTCLLLSNGLIGLAVLRRRG
ncbi:MAG: PEP-CTERM sorting domain-containing protein [Nitrospirales bacterium]|nr:PEP-CTERM sorting domain-containing protein [Nitrospirales bacterium]